MRYHARTHSCMIVINEKKSYHHAEHSCKVTYTGGHLVYIFDNETDIFVRELLTNDMIAFIGLKFTRGKYSWGDLTSEVTYFGWKRSPSNSGRHYAAITRTEWTVVSHSSYFVCQQTCGTARLCDGSVSSFPVSSRFQEIIIKLCVFISTSPRILRLKKAFGDFRYIKSGLYSWNFRYTNYQYTQVEIQLTIFRNHRLQVGKYNLVVDESACYDLAFEIKGPPECPSRFKAEALNHSSVKLTWRPGNDGGTKQMFIVMVKKMSGDLEMARVEDRRGGQMVHVLSNLSEATKYTFYIDVNNTQALTRCGHIHFSVVTKERDTFLLNDKPLVNKTQTFKKGENMIIKCQVSDDTVYSMELSHDSGQKLVTLITKDNASILSYESLVQCNSSGLYVCKVTSRSEVFTMQGYIRSECDAEYCNENTQNQTPSFELLYRNETCTVILCLWIYPQPSSFRLYKANEEIEDSNYDITFNYLTSYTTKGHLTLTLFQCYNFTPGPYHITAYRTKQRSSNIEFDLTVHIAKKVESHNNTNLVRYIIIVVSVNVIIISVIVAVIVIKLKRNSSKQEVSMTTDNIYNNISESEEISVNQRPGHFERWSLRSTVIADEEPKASTHISDSANSAELTPRTDAKDEASDSRMTGEAEQTYANVTCIADGQRREQVLTKDPGQGCRMNTQEKSRMSSAGNNKRIMTSHSDRQRTSNYDVGHTLGPEGDGRTLGSEGDGRTLGSEGDKRTLDSEGDGRILGPEGDGRTLGSVDDGRTLGSVGDGRTLGSKGDGRTLGSEGDKRTLGSEGDGRTLGSDGDWRSLESEGRKLSPDNIRTSMIRKHSKRASGRKSKSLRTSVKVNKYKDEHESCIIKNNSGIEGLTLDSKHEEQTDDSKDKGHTFATENDAKTADSVYKGHAIPSENKEYSMDSEYKGYKFASENDERTLDSEYKGRTLVSENDDQTIDSGYKWHTFASEYEGQTVDSDDKGQTVDPDDEGRRVTPRDKGHTVDFKNNDLTVNSKDESLTVISDSTNDGRTISPEGLVYVSVIINPDTKKPEVTATRHSKAPYESVEYASINYSATLEAKVDDEKE